MSEIAIYEKEPHPRHFGFGQNRVQRRLRLDVRAGPGRIARLGHQLALANLGVACKRGAAKVREEKGGRKQQRAIGGRFGSLPHRLFLDGVIFGAEFSHAAGDAELRVAAPIRKAILCALCERNDEANWRDRDGGPRARRGAARHGSRYLFARMWGRFWSAR